MVVFDARLTEYTGKFAVGQRVRVVVEYPIKGVSIADDGSVFDMGTFMDERRRGKQGVIVEADWRDDVGANGDLISWRGYIVRLDGDPDTFGYAECELADATDRMRTIKPYVENVTPVDAVAGVNWDVPVLNAEDFEPILTIRANGYCEIFVMDGDMVYAQFDSEDGAGVAKAAAWIANWMAELAKHQ